MNWDVDYLPEALKELKNLDRSVSSEVEKAIKKVQQNPLPVKPDGTGGYGHPLGHKYGYDLNGNLKVKLKRAGIRIVYRLKEQDGKMLAIIIGMREDEKVYKDAYERLRKYNLI